MSLTTRMDRHSARTHKMAETLNIDLAEKAMRGEMAGSDFRNLVMSCLACEKPDECQRFLEDYQDGATEAPVFCRNHDTFRSLRKA